MTTNNAVNTSLSGQTGTGNFVGSTSATLVTPNLGIATATSLVFNPTTNGIIGTTTNNNAVAGSVGELISSIVLYASAISLSTATATNITSISLRAGDWDIWGNVFGNFTGVGVAFGGWISTTSATFPDNSQVALTSQQGSFGSSAQMGITVPYARMSLPSTTTIYLSVYASFSTGAVTGCGQIFARCAR